ncbi:MAG: SHD1 domain-containing protein [Pirellulaceae bacterium]
MSKLDRQLDAINGDERVCIKWQGDEHDNVDKLRQFLVEQVDRRELRVPLDLRGVKGAPAELVSLLKETRRYARSKDKILVISYAMPEMLNALSNRGLREKRRNREEDDGDAGDVAQDFLLRQQTTQKTTGYDISKAETISRTKKDRTKQKRYLLMGSIISVATLLVGFVEYKMIFNQTTELKMPAKGFESHKPVEKFRIWNDKTGRFSVRALFIKMDNQTITLQREDGPTINVKIENLSDEDRRYLESIDAENPFRD